MESLFFPALVYLCELDAIWFSSQDISVSVVEKGDEELEKRTTVVFPCCRIEHLGLNVVLQLLVGVPLEMVHGAARISFVYIAGVVAGRWHLCMPQMEKQWKWSVLAFELEILWYLGLGEEHSLMFCALKSFGGLDIENRVQLDIYFCIATDPVFRRPAKKAPTTCYFKIPLL